MKKSANKSIKLVIRRETLRTLASKELTGVAGGDPALNVSGTNQCNIALPELADPAALDPTA